MNWADKDANTIEAIATAMYAKIIDENIQGPRRKAMLERAADYLKLADDRRNWAERIEEMEE